MQMLIAQFDLATQGEDLDATLMIAYELARSVIVGTKIFEFHKKNSATKEYDQVTELDYKAQAVIIETIERYFPYSGIIAEEDEHSKPSRDGLMWFVDPIDGTSEFIRGGNEISCMIGVVFNGKVIASLIGNPFTGEIYVLQARDGKLIRYRCEECPLEIELSFCKPPRKRAIFSFEDPRDKAISSLAHLSDPENGFFRTHLVFSGSYGTAAMKAASNQVTAFITKANNINPWDEIPALGILGKLGYKYYIYDAQSRSFEMLDMVPNPKKYTRELTLMTHPLIFEELQVWLNQN
jgi:fructose-1,6-bisphosphatase/inositol monophosphatase family enzyme